MDYQFLERLNIIKKRHKLSYSKLGGILGVSKDTAGNYLIGRTEIPMAEARKLAEELGEDPIWLLTGQLAVKNPESDNKDYRKAKAGRTEGINHLVKIRQLISKAIEDFPEGQYDLFDVDGNSMNRTLNHGDKLLCRMVGIDDIIDTRVYVIVTNKPDLAEYRKSGIWVKRLTHRKNNGYINCYSDNKDSVEPFPTFRLKPHEIEEIWYPMLRLCHDLSDPNRDIYDRLDEMEARIEMLESLNE